MKYEKLWISALLAVQNEWSLMAFAMLLAISTCWQLAQRWRR